jgi:hypothetical protein
MRKPNNRATALALLGIVFTLLGLLFSLGATISVGARAERVDRLDPASAATVASRAPGREVLVEGRLSPQNALAQPPFVAYVVERPGPDRAWTVAERIAPDLLIDLPDGQVRVLGGYLLDDTLWTVPQPDSRLLGFMPGDPVVAVGTVVAADTPTIAGELVFGGERAPYIEANRPRSSFPPAIGYGLLALGIALLLLALLPLLKRQRPA